jgi:oxygen-independent coproporphyrinogen-3 oxidase
MPVGHVSAYLLKIEEGTAFWKKRDDLRLPGEDETASLYLGCREMLKRRGFSQYEISNFAKGGLVSRHNLACWRLLPYLGLGPSAHSFDGKNRRYFSNCLSAFLNAEDPFLLWRDDGPGGDISERLMLNLRLAEGFDTSALKNPAGLLARARAFSQRGLCIISGEKISLTPKGFLLSNSVTASLLEALEQRD